TRADQRAARPLAASRRHGRSLPANADRVDPILARSGLHIDNHSVIHNPMVMSVSAPRLDATFAALADPTRRAILARLAQGETTVMDLAAPFAMSQPAVSKHLRVLERAGLVSRGANVARRPVKLEAKPMEDAVQWLETYRKFWETRFEALDAVLD